MSVSLSRAPAGGRPSIGFVVILLLAGTLVLSGCLPAWLGAGVAGGYAVGRSERGAGEMTSDALITMKVKAKLLADSKVRGLNIDVDTNLGHVTLNGVADSQAEIDRAVAIAKTVSGVESVTSGLLLREEEPEEGE